MQKHKCECEHISHFDRSQKSPNGNPNHKYGIEFNVKLMPSVKTSWGTFIVCPGCAEDCLSPPWGTIIKEPDHATRL